MVEPVLHAHAVAARTSEFIARSELPRARHLAEREFSRRARSDDARGRTRRAPLDLPRAALRLLSQAALRS